MRILGRAVPVISTPVGAYRIAADAAHDLDRADSADAFAPWCALVSNLRGEMQTRPFSGRELVVRQYK